MSDPSGPFWVDRLEQHFGGVDFMGLRQPGLDMANRLLPGLTNFTRQARYYTVIAWMHVRAEPEAERAKLLESAFVHAVREHAHTGPIPLVGLVGTGSVPIASENQDLLPLLKKERMVSVMGAAAFGPSAKALGVVENVGNRIVFDSFARELAETVELDRHAIDRISGEGMPRNLLVPLSALCPCEPAEGTERDLLEELLFRHERRRHGGATNLENSQDGPRRRTLGLLLDALEPTEDPERFLVERFLDSVLRNHGYAPPEPLREEAFGLGLLSLRWCFRYAIESLWVAFGKLIAAYSFGTTSSLPIVDWICDEAGGDGQWQPREDQPLRKVIERLGSPPGLEIQGKESTADLLEADDLPAAALSASTLLAILAHRTRDLSSTVSPYSDFLDMSQPWWVPISELAVRLDVEMSVGEWLTLMLDRYVVGQHFLTASRKWADGNDGFFFHPSEDGYRIADRVDLEGWKPDAGRTKIPTAALLLRGIQLLDVEKTKDGDMWMVTSSGKRTVERVLSNPGDPSRGKS